MAHNAQMQFVGRLRETFPQYFRGTNVVELGSLDINGSIRPFFHDCNYIGVDVGEGPGVDVVSFAHEVGLDPGSQDVVAACEMFEHDKFWFATWKKMISLARPKGLVFFTCATEGRPEHGTSRSDPASSPLTIPLWSDYYRNLTEADFRAEFDMDYVFERYEFSVHDGHKDLQFWGIKK